MEKLVVFAEKIMANKKWEKILGLISLLSPIYFLKTLYAVWFGPLDVFIGFQSERSTWLVLATVNAVGLFTLLPTRRNGRIMQIVMLMWVTEMTLLYLATIIR